MIHIVMMIYLLMITCYDLFIIGWEYRLGGKMLFISPGELIYAHASILSRDSLCDRCRGSARMLRFSYARLG